ncbi:MAG: hypothetical protein ACLUT1_05570 [Ruminococcus sp.]|nr:hypothetical protein [Ruminococcus sp.]CDE31748.1 putative uncharacterized protein [Ruminococcus sp. CAG:403]
MTNKELRKLKRTELLEMMLQLQKELEAERAEKEALQKQLEEARQQSIDKAVWKKLEQAADAYLQQLAQPSDAAEPIKEGEQA